MTDYDQEVFNNRNGKKINNLNPVLMKSINKIIQDEGYSTYSVCIKDVCTDGGNYLSLLKEVDITGKTRNNTDKETNLFIKQSLPESSNNLLSTTELFSKEIFIYTELTELFTELQIEFNVPDTEKYEFIKCYNYSNVDSLIFDNMTEKGFKICNRFDVAPKNVIELSIRELAKFHGFSMVLEQYRPDFYKNYIQSSKYPFVFNDLATRYLKSVYNISLSYMEQKRKRRLEKYIPLLLDKHDIYFHKNESKVKCLCHGDYRMNNILIKEVNGEASKVIPIDYQLIYYGSPVLDLIYTIFLSTDQKFRQNYMEDFKNVYYKSLTKFLRYFKIDVTSVYPKDEFEYDFKNQLDFGLMTAINLLPFVLASEDDVPEISDEMKTMKLHANFKPRIEEIVDDFIDWGYL